MLGRPVRELLADLGPADQGAADQGMEGLYTARLRRVAGAPLPVRVVAWPDTHGGAALVLVPEVPAPAAPPAAPAAPAGPAAPSRPLGPSAADIERIAGLGHWEVDLATGSAWLSPVLAELLMIDPHAARSAETLLAALHAEDRGGLARRWQALVTEGAPLECEVRLGDGSGRILALHAALRAGTVLGTAADVTARRHAEERLRASNQRFTDLLAVAPVGIALFDDDERLVKANQALCRLLGQGPEALRGRRADELLDLSAEAAAGPGPATPLLARPGARRAR